MTCVLACAFLALFLCSSKIIAELAKNTGGGGVGIVFDTANYYYALKLKMIKTELNRLYPSN